MKKTINLLGVLVVIILGSSFMTSNSTVLPWKKIGSKKVTYKLDRDVLHVGKNDGTFKKLKIKVTGGSINMHKMVIEYGNGQRDNVPLVHTFIKGSDSRVIDLQGRNRVIKDITFLYDTKNGAKRRATVHVYGRR